MMRPGSFPENLPAPKVNPPANSSKASRKRMVISLIAKISILYVYDSGQPLRLRTVVRRGTNRPPFHPRQHALYPRTRL